MAATWSERVNGLQDALLAKSRASVAHRKRLLASLEATAATNSGEARRESLTISTAPATIVSSRGLALLNGLAVPFVITLKANLI